ncbi:alpha/beta fold hydrolase [Cellulomonas sp.]|uniref:alpha/beta fold hydrolase n=1 Tax=Cellulomonas sp. TaxID=40001 RepID=UPI002D288104|nr:alpha/beta fold hydrolase [Cellulomonas sp.]HYQ75086.1 alpha/beta fold hydrolase [Cellulomonas sp.]
MAAVDWETREVDVAGSPVTVRVGPEVPGSTPLVHVHGFAVSGRYLLPTAAALADRGTTYVPDLPGHGASPGPRPPLSIPHLAEALLGTLDALGLDRVLLVGNSMGGPVSLETAHRAPDRVAGIVLASPAGGAHNQPLPRAVVQLLRDAVHEDPRMGRYSLPDYAHYGPVAGLAAFRQMVQFPSLERLLRTPVPTLAVVGSRDPLMPPPHRVRELAHLGPGHLTVVVVLGAAHAMNYSHPEELAHAVRCWLDGQPITDDPAAHARTRVLQVAQGDAPV